MTTKQTYLNILQKFKQEYAEKYGIERIGLFGSIARGEHTDQSDVDVVVEAPKLGYEVVSLRLDLEETFGKPVDLVTGFSCKSERFKNRVEREVIYV